MQELLELDRKLLLLARTRFHQPHVERLVKAYSDMGENGLIWVALALGAAAADPKRRRSWLRAAAVAPATLTINFVAKNAFRRKRPQIRGLEPLTGSTTKLSFPSAHASMSFATGHVISKLAPQARWHLFAASAAMAATRPYLGMHYPSDVLAGALLGSAVGLTVERWVVPRDSSS